MSVGFRLLWSSCKAALSQSGSPFCCLLGALRPLRFWEFHFYCHSAWISCCSSSDFIGLSWFALSLSQTLPYALLFLFQDTFKHDPLIFHIQSVSWLTEVSWWSFRSPARVLCRWHSSQDLVHCVNMNTYMFCTEIQAHRDQEIHPRTWSWTQVDLVFFRCWQPVGFAQGRRHDLSAAGCQRCRISLFKEGH